MSGEKITLKQIKSLENSLSMVTMLTDLYGSITGDDPYATISMDDLVAFTDPDQDVERMVLENEKKELLQKRLSQLLSPRERAVIEMRYGFTSGEPMTLAQVGSRMHISRERVRQLELRAIRRLRHWLNPDDLSTRARMRQVDDQTEFTLTRLGVSELSSDPIDETTRLALRALRRKFVCTNAKTWNIANDKKAAERDKLDRILYTYIQHNFDHYEKRLLVLRYHWDGGPVVRYPVICREFGKYFEEVSEIEQKMIKKLTAELEAEEKYDRKRQSRPAVCVER